ncbi:MAG: caspase family protein [Desulfobacula sp.]|uniref:caspase family protein n=1 Tax=Desulfobacula sp. TaxID=2593537 RepID=UPI0025C2E6B0|nr:caspase family protein [Desulfobacula sp.]MCD4722514.1 caspase family protein [Desulfobacula sp.]
MKYFTIILILIVFSLPAYSATWFAGTGNDGYITDVNGIFLALSNSPGLQDISTNNFIYGNQAGSGIQNSINNLSSFVQQGDILFWYYSGHGSFTEDIDQDEIVPSALNNYDEALGLLNNSDRITDDNLALAFNNLSLAGTTIITLFDTCYAGGFIGGNNDLNTVPGLIFFGSSTEVEDSYAYTNEPYSIFTQGLILGLEDFNADLDKDGIILAQEWFDFSYDYTTGRVSNQHPVFSGNGDMVISSMHSVPIPGSGWLFLTAYLVLLQARKSRGP